MTDGRSEGTIKCSQIPGGKKDDDADGGPKAFSVGEFLTRTNDRLRELDARVRGEVTEVSVSTAGNVYIDLKDAESEAVLSCFVSSHVYEISGVEVVEGMEIIADGYPSVYERSGRFSLRTQAIEVAGEGALKAAYEKLKKNLAEKGVFSEERKQKLPSLPQRIGVITSRTGSVIDDIRSNLGDYGFEVKLYDARVEGKRALSGLLEALAYFQEHPVDVIVIGRGGGSLESLQAFNSEALVRAVAEANVPVIASIGHDKDVPLVALAADEATSTPTGAAVLLRESWQKAKGWLAEHAARQLTAPFEGVLSTTKQSFEKDSFRLASYLSRVVNYIENLTGKFTRSIQSFLNRVFQSKHALEQGLVSQLDRHERALIREKDATEIVAGKLLSAYARVLKDRKVLIFQAEKSLRANNPKRLLSRGYSIASTSDGVVTSTESVSAGDVANIRVSDGTIETKVTDTKKNTND
jgi:exodeoxyribonuclease VII large subunit